MLINIVGKIKFPAKSKDWKSVEKVIKMKMRIIEIKQKYIFKYNLKRGKRSALLTTSSEKSDIT